jgi:hypothetical protein
LSSRPKWSLPLSRPIEIKGGPTLRTLQDAADYVLSKPQDDQPWQHVAGALVQAATSGKVDDVTRQIESVLWHRGMWVLQPKAR